MFFLEAFSENFEEIFQQNLEEFWKIVKIHVCGKKFGKFCENYPHLPPIILVQTFPWNNVFSTSAEILLGF